MEGVARNELLINQLKGFKNPTMLPDQKIIIYH